jgi:hypothetical protein
LRRAVPRADRNGVGDRNAATADQVPGRADMTPGLGTVWVECPTTGEPTSTGVRVDAAAFESAVLAERSVRRCVSCGRTHMWSRLVGELRFDETG